LKLLNLSTILLNSLVNGETAALGNQLNPGKSRMMRIKVILQIREITPLKAMLIMMMRMINSSQM